jgi:hypothetical protein
MYKEIRDKSKFGENAKTNKAALVKDRVNKASVKLNSGILPRFAPMSFVHPPL